MVLSISGVALAGLIFVATQGGGDKATPAAHHAVVRPHVTSGSVTTPAVITPTSTPTPTVVVHRGKVDVVIFNNSNVKGLAGKTSSRAQSVGWNVVATANWYGTVDASTVYFGPKLKAAAELLARDLGITRIKPAIAPMQFNRVTVILTGDYH
ncbi:MAG: hypothetical protein JWR52_1748 [Marmoricola sp.]|nr:hypothetical protein [Marmoricola sp.]